jgi:hypothetical protein
MVLWAYHHCTCIVHTKIVHYSSICYIPLSFLAATFIYKRRLATAINVKWPARIVALLGVVFGIIMCGVPKLMNYLPMLSSTTNDQFTKDTLSMQYNWQWWHTLPGATILFFILYFVIQKQRGSYLLPRALALMCVWQALLYGFVKPIEHIAQGTEIACYKQVSTEDAYIASDFQNYGRYFYGNLQPQNALQSSKPWPTYTDKKIYLLSRSNAVDRLHREHPQLKILRSKGGFVLWEQSKP